MARFARAVLPGVPHHVTQRGAALRYVALNPVRARLAERATDWPWSSVHAHLGGVAGDGLTTLERVLSRYPDFAALIAAGEDEACRNGCADPKASAGRSVTRRSSAASSARAAVR